MAAKRKLQTRSAIQELEAQRDALQVKIDEIQRQGREDMGRLCERAGLLDIDITPADLEAALKEVAARFRNQQVAPVGPETTPAPAGPGAA
jgi:TraC-like protein